jgi:hypothetical protein
MAVTGASRQNAALILDNASRLPAARAGRVIVDGRKLVR